MEIQKLKEYIKAAENISDMLLCPMMYRGLRSLLVRQLIM